VSENEKECDDAALQPPGRSASREFPHNESEIERTGMNHQPFDDVVVTPEMRPSQGASFVHVSEAAFYPFSTLAQKSLGCCASCQPSQQIAVQASLARTWNSVSLYFRMVPYSIQRAELTFASLLLLNFGCLLRVSSEIPAYEGYSQAAWRVLPVSAVVELIAVSLFALNLALTIASPRQTAAPCSGRLSTDDPYLIPAAHHAAGEHLRIHADARQGLP
jgi:hypothetical protein